MFTMSYIEKYLLPLPLTFMQNELQCFMNQNNTLVILFVQSYFLPEFVCQEKGRPHFIYTHAHCKDVGQMILVIKDRVKSWTDYMSFSFFLFVFTFIYLFSKLWTPITCEVKSTCLKHISKQNKHKILAFLNSSIKRHKLKYKHK